MKISVCIPMYNENAIITDTAQQLSLYMSQNFDDYEIIFCDDGSHDGCAETVKELHLPNTQVISYEQNRGKGYAVRTAMLASTGDICMFTDADLAYGTDVIKRVEQAFLQNPDASLVIGSRNISKDGYEGYTFIRRLASRIYIRILCMVGGFRLSDSQCGCKAFTGAAAETIFSKCEVNRFAFDFEAILWATNHKMKIVEMPVKVINHGASKVHIFRDTFRMLKDLHRMKKRIRREAKKQKKENN